MINNFFTHLDKVFLIAEIGVNHNGDLGLAKKLIETAKQRGADAVKFQTYMRIYWFHLVPLKLTIKLKSFYSLGYLAADLSVAMGARVIEKHFTLDKEFVI